MRVLVTDDVADDRRRLKEDTLRLYRLCRACNPKVESWGVRPAEFEGAAHLV